MCISVHLPLLICVHKCNFSTLILALTNLKATWKNPEAKGEVWWGGGGEVVIPGSRSVAAITADAPRRRILPAAPRRWLGSYQQPHLGDSYRQPHRGGGYRQSHRWGGYRQPHFGGSHRRPQRGGCYLQSQRRGSYRRRTAEAVTDSRTVVACFLAASAVAAVYPQSGEGGKISHWPPATTTGRKWSITLYIYFC